MISNNAFDTTEMIAQLADRGWGAAKDFFPSLLTAALLSDMQSLQQDGQLQQAGTGRQGSASRAAEIPVRTDSTLWLTGHSEAQRRYMTVMEQVRLDLNRALYLGLFDYECHYALYEPGGFYKKHLDSLKGTRNRIVSCVTYLTPGWTEADAGHLALYNRNDADIEAARILPEAGTLAFFLSEEIPHEVLPPRRARASIAGWFRCNASTGGRVDPAG